MILSGKAVQRYMDAEDMWCKKKSLRVLYEIFDLQNEDVLVSPTKVRGLRLELS